MDLKARKRGVQYCLLVSFVVLHTNTPVLFAFVSVRELSYSHPHSMHEIPSHDSRGKFQNNQVYGNAPPLPWVGLAFGLR